MATPWLFLVLSCITAAFLLFQIAHRMINPNSNVFRSIFSVTFRSHWKTSVSSVRLHLIHLCMNPYLRGHITLSYCMESCLFKQTTHRTHCLRAYPSIEQVNKDWQKIMSDFPCTYLDLTGNFSCPFFFQSLTSLSS